ncbi:MAG: hypothetical protein WAT92_02970 [Saprospiraceae bacterium]
MKSSENYFAKKVGIIIICFLLSQRIYAQDVSSNIQGFSVSIYGVGSKVTSNSLFLSGIMNGEPIGIGIGANVGYGFTESMKVFFGYQSQKFNRNDTYDKNTADAFELGLNYNFLASLNHIRPFLRASMSYNSLNVYPTTFTVIETGVTEENITILAKGLGFDAGVGLQYFIKPEVSVSVSGGGKFGGFTTIYYDGTKETVEQPVDFKYFYAKIGLSYSFY